MKRVQYQGPTKISCRRAKFHPPSDLPTGICVRVDFGMFFHKIVTPTGESEKEQRE